MIREQFFVFTLSLGCGVIIGVLFDVFRAFRQKFSFSNISVAVQDVLFWIFASLITFLITRLANGGELRWYIFFAAFSGALLYNATISHAVIHILIFIMNFTGRAAQFLLKILLSPIVFLIRIFKKPFFLICMPLRKSARFFKVHLSRWGEKVKKVKKRLKLS